jgi:two-component system, sensor histidine kinase LadS
MFSQRVICLGLACFASLAMAIAPFLAAASDLPVPVDVSHPVLDTRTHTFVVLQDVPANWTVAQVAAEPESRFRIFDPKKTYAVSIDKAIWLRFRVAAGNAQSANLVVFELPKPYVDEVQFHYQNHEGQWEMQLAGELTARTQWPVRGLYPRFELPPAGAAVQDIYVKVLQFVPIRFSPQLKTLNDSNFEMQNKLFVYGLVLGLMALMGVFSLVLAVSYRRYIYAWYSLYAAVAGAAIASYVGVGNHIFWPDSTVWAESSIIICTLAAMVAQVQFCRVMFLRDPAMRWLNQAALASLAISVSCVVGLFMLPLNAVANRLGLFFIGFTCCVVMLILMIGCAMYLRNKVAWLWVLAFSPLLLLVPVTVAEGLGLISLPNLPYDAVVYTMAFEAMVLMFAMQVHVKMDHHVSVRGAIKDELDPLTGFLAPQQFEVRFKALWSQAEMSQNDLAIAYVQVSLNPRHGTTGGPFNHERSVRRVVKILHTASRDVDTVALVAGNVFAILMPGISPSENLSSKLSRLVALGLMPDKDDPKAAPIYIRIAASSMRSYFGSPKELDALLFKSLRNKSLWQDRSIRMVRD